MNRLPREVLDLIGLHVQDREWWEWIRNTQKKLAYVQKQFTENTSWKNDIANLRLVNHHFNTVFSYFLFEHIVIESKPQRYENGHLQKLANLFKLSQSKMGGCVDSLVIRLDGYYSHLHSLNKATSCFFEDFCHNLPLYVKACHNIRRLDLLCKDFTPSCYGSFTFYDQVNTTLATTLTQGGLERLQHLALRLSQVADFAALVRHNDNSASAQPWQPLRRILSRLSSLTFEICDSTGEKGYYNLLRSCSPAKSGCNQQRENEEAFFSLAGLATGVSSLEMACECTLNVDVLIMGQRQVFRNLRNLSLERVQASGEGLIQLFEETRATLWKIQLRQVELTAQTWEDVCVQLCSSPLLQEVHIGSCGYVYNGLSSCFRAEVPRSNDTILVSLESARFGDISALYELVELVNFRRRQRGLCEIGCTWYHRDPSDVSGKGIVRGSFWHVPEQEWFEA